VKTRRFTIGTRQPCPALALLVTLGCTGKPPQTRSSTAPGVATRGGDEPAQSLGTATIGYLSDGDRLGSGAFDPQSHPPGDVRSGVQACYDVWLRTDSQLGGWLLFGFRREPYPLVGPRDFGHSQAELAAASDLPKGLIDCVTSYVESIRFPAERLAYEDRYLYVYVSLAPR
jgi:hypothetical protein